MKNALEVFQVCDSTFPIGTFHHSFGMENYLYRGVIRKAPQFRTWIRNYFRSQFRYGEGLLILLCFRAMDGAAVPEETDRGEAAHGDAVHEDAAHEDAGHEADPEDADRGAVPETILRYDDLITKSTLAFETREGTKMVARQMGLLIQRMYGDSISYLSDYLKKVEEEEAFGNPAIVFSMFAHEKGVSAREALEMYGYSVASTLVQNAVRAVPLGQSEGQVILHEIIGLICGLYPKIKDLGEEYLGANAPGLELAQIAHETQPARLFMS